MANDFEFPDQQGVDGPGKKQTAEPDIEVVDDTPIYDRGRAPMPKEIVDEIEKDDLSEYSEKVRQRMAALKKVYHDERRAKEATAREREEAIRFAQNQHEELQQLRQRLNTGERVFITEVTAAAKTGLESARSKLKAAYESGDAELITAATEAMQEAQLKMRDVSSFRPSSLQGERTGVEGRSQVQASQPVQSAPDPKAEAWRSKNMWFGTDKEMTAAALGLHEKLVESGFDPRSDDYFKKIDETMHRRFPENFEDGRPEPRRTVNVVASATRSSAPRRITLTTSQVALAQKLGVTKEAYAREFLKLENANG